MKSAKNVALVAIGRPIKGPYSYKLPQKSTGLLKIGDRVLIDIRGKKDYGIIVGLTDDKNIDFELKEILSAPDIFPLIAEQTLYLSNWITEYYHSFAGETLNAMIPDGVDVKTYDLVSISQKAYNNSAEWQSSNKLTGKVLRYITRDGYTTFQELTEDFDRWEIRTTVQTLYDNGYLTIHPFITNPATGWDNGEFLLNNFQDYKDLKERLKRSKAKKKVIELMKSGEDRYTIKELEEVASRSVITEMMKMGYITYILNEEKKVKPEIGEIPPSTDEQNEIIESILKEGFDNYHPYLLYGVTGSGKTHIYIKLCSEILKKGKNAIILVPEISLTPQTIERFRNAFGNTAEVIHSAQTQASRFEVWRKCRLNLISIIVGPRSAILTPMDDLGLIIVDEEHDTSYKQSDREPRYNGRDVAVMRAHRENISVILGSATPSVETFYNSKSGKYNTFTLNKRIFDYPLPEIEILNLNREEKYREIPFLSKKLVDSIFETLDEKKQVILLQNRRGYSTVLTCKECGKVIRCPNCDVTLTYHKSKQTLLCHYCGKSRGIPDVCPECGSDALNYYGLGTERVLEELERIFSDYSLVRMDSDTTQKTGSHEEILYGFQSGEFQILIGTQMVAQGLDFPDVGLVGVLSADTSLCFPDFMAGERTFQLLTHIIGRSGRCPEGGKAIIQTHHPHHYAIRFAYNQDYISFYDYEIKYRRALGYPPITKLASILIEDRRKDVAREQAEKLRNLLLKIVDTLKLQDKSRIRGPAPAPIARLRGFHRWQILITTTDLKTRQKIIDGMKGVKLGPQGKWGKIVLDIDPIDLI
jgi:primosomal protein N' (replication factor Y)